MKSSTPKIVFFITDDNINVTYLYSRFKIQPMEEEATSLRFQIFELGPQLDSIQLYIFPRNREFKSYCELYISILPHPDILLYAIDTEASIKQSIQWLNLFQKDNSLRVVFFSSAKTYLQRQQVLTKINALFIKDIDDYVYFPNINEASFENCLFNIKNTGVSMKNYIRLPTAFSRLKWIWRKLINKKKPQQQSSVI